jgi:hypothetical protein
MFPSRSPVTLAAAIAALLACHSAVVNAQQPASIERIRITDNQMNCAQLYAENGEMDKVIAAAQAAESSGNTTAMAGSAANVAAEVAGRTGLFGQLGGMAGALFGKAAAQGAAGVAQQSGQMSAQQAAARAKQAVARKEHVTAIFVSRGCKASDLSYDPPLSAQNEAMAQVMQASLSGAAAGSAAGGALPNAAADLQKLLAPATSITALPDADPDAHFRGKMGGTFGKNVIEVMPNSKRVAVAGFRVVFITEQTATAVVRGSYMPGRDTSGARSSLKLTLSGVDQATMQAITDKAYADFLAQLRFAGREVVPQEELKDFFASVNVAAPAGQAAMRSASGQTAAVFSPRGVPLWFYAGDAPWGEVGPFDQKNIRNLAESAANLKAIVVAPMIVVNFARMMSSGNQSGFTARAAETGASLAMHVSGFSSHYMRSEETRGGIVMNGDEGGIQMAAHIGSDRQFGTIRDVAASDNSAVKGVFDSLGRAGGLANAGGANRSSTESVAETSGPAFAAAAVDALGRTTGTFAKWFQKYPAR